MMNRKFFTKDRIILIVTMIVVFAVGIFLFTDAQKYSIRVEYETQSVNFTDSVTASMESRENDLKALDEYNKSVSADLVYNITYIYDGTDFPHLNWRQREKLKPSNICSMDEMNLEALYICDDEGTIWISDDESLIKKNIVEEGIITADNLDFFNSDGYGTYKLKVDENGDYYSSNEPVSGFYDGHKVKYYAVKVFGKNPDERYYAVGADNSELELQINKAYSDLGAYFDPIVDYDGFSAFAVNLNTGIIEYASPVAMELKGRLAADVGLENISEMDDGQFHEVELGGSKHRIYVQCHDSESMGNYAIAAADMTSGGPLENAVTGCIIVMLIVTILLFNAGCKLAKQKRKHLIKEYMACVLACIILVSIVCFYLSTISGISQAMTQCEVNAEAFSKYYKSGRENAENMSEFYKTKKVSVLKSIAIYLQQNQDALMDENGQKVYEYYDRNDDGSKKYVLDSNGNVTRSISESADLKDIAEDESYKELYILNSQGNTVITSSENWYFTIHGGKSGYDEQFNSVLERKTKDFYDYVTNEDNGKEVVAVPYEMYISDDGSGNTRYHSTDEYLKDDTGTIRQEYGLLVAISNTTSDLRLSMESIPREMLNSMRAAEGAELAVTAKSDEGYKFVLVSDGIRDEDFAEMAIPESYYLSDNYKFVNLNDIDRMLGISCISSLKEMNIVTVLDNSDIQSQRLPIVAATVMATVLAGIVLIIYFAKIYNHRENRNGSISEASGHDGDGQQSDGFAESTSGTAIGGWVRSSGIWGLILLMMAAIAYSLLTGGELMRFVQYVLTSKWEKGVHIFSISYFIYMIAVVMVVISIAREFVHLLAPVLNASAETMLRLLLSLVQYGSIIACIFYTLYLFGFQMGTVVTSASIMTIVIGLGANSLIGDILAGLFIIFEHEYQVGNWITIGGYTGVVRAIGLRTTKVENCYGNIKTFNNSKINEVINLTDNCTTADVLLYISNKVPVRDMDILVTTKLKEKISGLREIVDGPMPGEIDDKTGYDRGYYGYRVIARCEQKDLTKVKNTMISQLMELLKEENIEFL